MKVIDHERYNLLLERNCKKGKHRIRENKFGVCWCTICGLLSNGEVPDKLEEDSKLLIQDEIHNERTE